MNNLPVSVLVITKNEEDRLVKCLAALSEFSEIIVADSSSTDNTVAIAESMSARAIDFRWNGGYPKKRQWCLDNIDFRHDWIFMVDADEIVTPELCHEIRDLFRDGAPDAAGYFVQGRYIRSGQVLYYGLRNNKLALLNRHKMEYPVVDDLDIEGIGELEGHYQPVLKAEYQGAAIGSLRTSLFHEAYHGGIERWEDRHRRYAQWEAAMDLRGAWPQDPSPWRQKLKMLFKAMPFRPLAAFAHSYILKAGFLDGRAGYLFARDRARYYKIIAAEKKKLSCAS